MSKKKRYSEKEELNKKLKIVETVLRIVEIILKVILIILSLM